MILYRGDSDPRLQRQLVTSLTRKEGLFTNLINSGNPLALGQQPFINSLQQHITTSWGQTHFLSFSSDINVAEMFAKGPQNRTLSSGSFTNFNTIIAEIDTNQFNMINNFNNGIIRYQYSLETDTSRIYPPQGLIQKIALDHVYQPRLNKQVNTVEDIIIIDVVAHLNFLISQGVQVNSTALQYAMNDKEFLVLPITPLVGSVGNTALFEFGALANIRFYN
ncbi:MAG: hypothetical protein H6622_07610 [Halobacteriovoraceae bacterium]|nr:hypothetical protein [Halobacteriovoraceae bacterium]